MVLLSFCCLRIKAMLQKQAGAVLDAICSAANCRAVICRNLSVLVSARRAVSRLDTYTALRVVERVYGQEMDIIWLGDSLDVSRGFPASLR